MAEYIFKEAERSSYLTADTNEIITTYEKKERIVRCRDCKKRLPKGFRFDEFCNEAKQDACNLFSSHDFDWDYTTFWYVEPDSYCAWGELR